MADNIIFRPIHYLGSKLRMLECIQREVDRLDPENGIVCDLFSGSGTVSSFLNKSREVISVDVQEYSKVLCMALTEDFSNVNPEKLFLDILESNHTKKLYNCFWDLINYEDFSINLAKKENIESLYEIIENGSLIKYEYESNYDLSENFESVLKQTFINLNQQRFNNNKAMVTKYFGGLYFSYKQAVFIDAVLEFANNTNSKEIHDLLLGALLSTVSDIVNTVGKQFAQPLKVIDRNGNLKKSLKKKIISDRTVDIKETFKKWVFQYQKNEVSNNSFEFIQGDCVEVLKSLKNKKISVIYADPPYTRYHYSRYYHVLETICLRDNPRISHTNNNDSSLSRAIYRSDRYQSSFCIKTKAEKAFENLFRAASEISAPLILSYSPFDENKAITPRLQTIDQLIELGKKYYSDVEIVSPGKFIHTKLNKVEKTLNSNDEAELLLIFKN